MSLSATLRARWATLWLLGFLCLLYIPFAGNYGLWDPWETHYGEVARQMVERNDWISLWWPGSPQDGATFWSKPVMTFWLMGMSLLLFGLGHGGAAHAGEMALGFRAEWALRLPFVLLGILGVWAVWHLVRRIAGRGPALWSCLVLATCTQWALITRQAMTDMAFVTPMTVALCFAGLALLLPREEVQRELPRKRARVLGLEVSWPHDGAFYVFLALYVLCTLPQLVIDCVGLKTWNFAILGRNYRTLGFVPMLPWVGLFLLSLPWMMRVRDRRSIYLWVAYFMGGIATLAKGPAGIAMPAIVIFFFIAVTGRWGEFLGQRRNRPWFWGRFLPGPLRDLADHDGGLEVVRGSLLFLCVAAPWYAAMLVRHGLPFWLELIGDNYVHRAQGRHGDRGTYEYYLRQLGEGMFPWSGGVLAALLVAGRWLRQWAGTPRQQLVILCLTWFLVDFMVVSLVNTKFHHYILPAVPALAILLGLFLDELCQSARGVPRDSAVALVLVGLPLTWLCGRDLATFPARIGWLFNYDYVNAPGGVRPWPLTSIYGERYEYGTQIMILVALCTLLTALVSLLAWRLLPLPPGPEEGQAVEPDRSDSEAADGPVTGGWLLGGALLFLGLLIAGIAIAPSPETVSHWSSSKLPLDAVFPRLLRFGFLVPAALAAIWGLLFVWLLRRRGLLPIARRDLFRGGLLLGGLAIVWNCWVLDRFMIDLSPHWSQKHVFASYYKLRKGGDEPIVAWQLYWRGENLYTENAIYDHRLDAAEKTVFLGDHRSEKMQAYFTTHRKRRIFFVLERGQLETVRGLLPAEARQSLQVVDESNNKIYLAVAQL